MTQLKKKTPWVKSRLSDSIGVLVGFNCVGTGIKSSWLGKYSYRILHPTLYQESCVTGEYYLYGGGGDGGRGEEEGGGGIERVDQVVGTHS